MLHSTRLLKNALLGTTYIYQIYVKTVHPRSVKGVANLCVDIFVIDTVRAAKLNCMEFTRRADDQLLLNPRKFGCEAILAEYPIYSILIKLISFVFSL